MEPEFYELTESMSALEENRALDFPYEQAADTMLRMQQQVGDYRAELNGRAEQLQRDIKDLKTTIENLEKGIKPFPGHVTALKRLLEETLFSRHKKTVNVFILADLLEIKDPAWRNAIEGYLDKQKFYLLVPEEYYKEALRIYNQEKREKEIYDTGLVDIGKLRKNFGKKPMAGSLAEEIETENPDARLYADYLLGGVMKCDDVGELNQHKISITKTCMLYKGYVSRKLNPSRYATPFIGRRSMEFLLQQNRDELQRQETLYEETAGFHRIVRAAAETPILGEYEAKQYQKAVEDGGQLEELREQRDRVQAEYDELDLLYLKRMEDQIKALKAGVETKKNLWHDLDKKNERLDAALEALRGEKLPEAVRQVLEIQQRIEREFDHIWIVETGEPRFQEVQGGTFEVSLRERFFAAMRQTEIKRDNLRKNRTENRSRYNADYKMPYDVEEESNRFFDKELDELEQIRLPEYIEKIRDSREKAYNQFQDDFIAKIKSNIESVTQQIEELNASLKQSVFGTDRYRFVKKPRPEYQNYYNMIMDPLLMDNGGWNIASQSFNEKYQKKIDELFQLLIQCHLVKLHRYIVRFLNSGSNHLFSNIT